MHLPLTSHHVLSVNTPPPLPSVVVFSHWVGCCCHWALVTTEMVLIFLTERGGDPLLWWPHYRVHSPAPPHLHPTFLQYFHLHHSTGDMKARSSFSTGPQGPALLIGALALSSVRIKVTSRVPWSMQCYHGTMGARLLILGLTRFCCLPN